MKDHASKRLRDAMQKVHIVPQRKFTCTSGYTSAANTEDDEAYDGSDSDNSAEDAIMFELDYAQSTASSDGDRSRVQYNFCTARG